MFVTPAPPSYGAKFSEEAAEIERFRARHRRMLAPEAAAPQPARRRYVVQSTGTEMHVGFNAFDFSSAPEAFYDEEPAQTTSELVEEDEEEKCRQHMEEVAEQVTAMGFNSASLWEQSFPGLRQPGGPIRHCRLSDRIS
ncbi:hypothetical protein GQ600_4871 [Phytophthora cactorum]|nr:hypothetical protein GQ600_4871 [Phytophthora cactorum]